MESVKCKRNFFDILRTTLVTLEEKVRDHWIPRQLKNLLYTLKMVTVDWEGFVWLTLYVIGNKRKGLSLQNGLCWGVNTVGWRCYAR